MKTPPVLYVKTGCPWCTKALAFFAEKNFRPVVKDVLRDGEAMARMQQISGQTKTPTLEYGDFVVADFDTDEFMTALAKRPDVKTALGF